MLRSHHNTIAMLLAACLTVTGIGLWAADKGSETKEPARKDLADDPLPEGALARMGTLHWRHGGAITFVAFLPDGRLGKEPLLIEASASEKGPALMQSAMKALTNCQPYTMLSADRYNEWRMLDLAFTPKDFKGG